MIQKVQMEQDRSQLIIILMFMEAKVSKDIGDMH